MMAAVVGTRPDLKLAKREACSCKKREEEEGVLH